MKRCPLGAAISSLAMCAAFLNHTTLIYIQSSAGCVLITCWTTGQDTLYLSKLLVIIFILHWNFKKAAMSEQFHNQTSKTYKEAKSIPLTHIYMSAHFPSIVLIFYIVYNMIRFVVIVKYSIKWTNMSKPSVKINIAYLIFVQVFLIGCVSVYQIKYLLVFL